MPARPVTVPTQAPPGPWRRRLPRSCPTGRTVLPTQWRIEWTERTEAARRPPKPGRRPSASCRRCRRHPRPVPGLMSRPSRGPQAGRRPRGCPARRGPRLPRPISAAREPEPSPGPLRRALARHALERAAATKVPRAARLARPARARAARLPRPARARAGVPARRGRQVRVRHGPAPRGRVRHGPAPRGQVPGRATTRSARRRPAWAPRPRPAARDPARPDPAQASATVLASRQAIAEGPAARGVPAARARRTAVRAGLTARVRAVRVPAAPGRAR